MAAGGGESGASRGESECSQSSEKFCCEGKGLGAARKDVLLFCLVLCF